MGVPAGTETLAVIFTGVLGEGFTMDPGVRVQTALVIGTLQETVTL